ncbi:hypothetical protein ACFQS1_01820 [Paractinoplanes rhizophilus]|jgi:hypothetical protein|uniref:Uncharacterized protein n=1 Tax=Paractinoplanes rhizophilus TaxID=1416877 RepID=A0ABW2HIG3_9ACTN|nr:hypothetical protein [Actinoplanes sp.]
MTRDEVDVPGRASTAAASHRTTTVETHDIRLHTRPKPAMENEDENLPATNPPEFGGAPRAAEVRS